MGIHPSRRAMLAALAANALAAEKPLVVQSEARRFRDALTEFELTRLTDPKAANAWLPRPHLRSMGPGGRWLVYASDRSGSVQLYRMQAGSGESTQLTNAQALQREMACATPDGRGLLFFDGPELRSLGGRRVRTSYRTPADWIPVPPFAVSHDGQNVALVEQNGARFRLRITSIRSGAANTLFEANEPVSVLRFRQQRPNLLYGTPEGLTLADIDGRNSRRLRLPEGQTGDAQWSADGQVLHYLLTSASDHGRRVALRDHNPENGEDKLVGVTTQFASFSRNADSTVFAGVSGSVAAPYVLLLLRAARRELTLAEHKASAGSKAVVVFSPDSQRILFQSDRDGRSAIYSMALERFVEKTEEKTDA
jgi:oligogalacturonide lyase